MAEIIRNAIIGYNFVFDEIADPRTKSWLFVAKPYQGLAIITLYLMFVLKWGPQWMKNRTPFKLNKFMMVYNLVQMFLCGYLFVNGLQLWGKYKLFCEPVNYSLSSEAKAALHLTYLYFLLKIFDLFDTVIFILRKKFQQVSFLHVYHHTGMVILIWGGITYYPGGHGTSVGVINSFVHVIMYAYYFLTIAAPQFTKYSGWKKYITQIQIIQFFLCVVHVGSIVFIPDCAYPRWIAAIFVPQDLFMLTLFLDFYIKAYIKKPKVTAKNQDIKKIPETAGCSDDNGAVQNMLIRRNVTEANVQKNNRY